MQPMGAHYSYSTRWHSGEHPPVYKLECHIDTQWTIQSSKRRVLSAATKSSHQQVIVGTIVTLNCKHYRLKRIIRNKYITNKRHMRQQALA